MIASLTIIESIQYDIETFIKTDTIVGAVEMEKIFYENSIQFSDQFARLIPENAVMICFDLNIRIEAQCTFTSYFSLGFANVFFVEKKLAVQIADIDSV